MENYGFAIVFMNTRSPFVLEGVHVDGVYLFRKKTQLSNNKKQAIEEIKEMKIDRQNSKGLKVIVSEIIPDVAKYFGFYCQTINGRHSDDEPVINIALSRYQELKSSESIMFEKGLSGAYFEISDSVMEIKYNQSGEPYFHIDWDSIRDEAKAMLLGIYTGVFHAVDTSAYLTDLRGELSRLANDANKNNRPDLMPLERIVSNEAQLVHERLEKERLTPSIAGRVDKNDKNSWIL